MSYAIRFLPATDCNCGCEPALMANPAEHARWCPYVAGMPGAAPADVSPALYLSADRARDGASVVTSVASDVQRYHDGMRWMAIATANGNGFVLARCDRDRLRADVVTLDEALRDLGHHEERPTARPGFGSAMHAAYAALGTKERAVLARYKARRAERTVNP